MVQAQAATASRLKSLEDLQVSSSYTSELPGDDETENRLRQVHKAFWSPVSPTSTATEPYLVAYSQEMAEELGLDPAEVTKSHFAEVFTGNAPIPGSHTPTYAMRYGGHQFGSWAGQLGDGRVVNLGEIEGKTGQKWELQLKGAGKTPYSRMADGRAVMRSSIREFIGSEAMYHLGVPTSRALSVAGTGADVVRDMFYDGRIKAEPGAVVCRVAHSWIRFGSFQLPAALEEEGFAKQLADYVIKHHYTAIQGKPDPYLSLLQAVISRSAKLVAKWQAVGFVHGVLNTDNMSILGETIDYGPFGFLERFDPNFTPNTTDFSGRRYAYRNQPGVVQWNLMALATSFVTEGLCEKEAAEEALSHYSEHLNTLYTDNMAAKLGLLKYDKDVAVQLMTLMYEAKTDFTNTFRSLASVQAENESDELPGPLQQAVGQDLPEEQQEHWKEWLKLYKSVLKSEGQSSEQRIQQQDSANPCYIPRNHLLQKAIEKAEDRDFSEVNRLMEILKQPYKEQKGCEAYTEPAPVEVRMGVECLSCSS
ncbi:hypothetical protein ABBQ38_011026 [Trebouxia sp. C0009 RCD-2024]